jgi:hypothetical protein
MEHVKAVVADLLSTLSHSRGGPANAIVPIANSDHLPEVHSRDLSRIERLVVWTSAAGQLELARPLTGEETAWLSVRMHALERALEPWRGDSRDDLLGVISRMLGGFPNMQRHDRVAALGIAMAYLEVAAECPPWAILKACQLVRRGKAGLNPSFCPTEPEFNILARRLLAPYVEALRRARQLLDADVREELKPKLGRKEIEAKLGRKIRDPPRL